MEYGVEKNYRNWTSVRFDWDLTLVFFSCVVATEGRGEEKREKQRLGDHCIISLGENCETSQIGKKRCSRSFFLFVNQRDFT